MFAPPTIIYFFYAAKCLNECLVLPNVCFPVLFANNTQTRASTNTSKVITGDTTIKNTKINSVIKKSANRISTVLTHVKHIYNIGINNPL